VRRREFITLFGSAATAWPLVARAQQPAMPVIGFLCGTSPERFADNMRAFRQGLSETGYIEDRNVAVEYRWAEDHTDRLPALAADLVRRQVTVIATVGATPAALAAKSATVTIPIVFQIGTDPVALGLVASLNQPGGNVTGLTSLNAELGRKRLEVLHELIPSASILAMLINPANPTTAEEQSRGVLAAARSLGLQLDILRASNEHDLDTIFAGSVELRESGLVISPDPFFANNSERLAALATHSGLPTISPYREFAAAGGLMSYGGSLTDQYRLVGVYVGRILKGAKPADLPVQQATKVELVINIKTAKALAITFPLSLLGRADEVIE
jgi:putative ABC transport system substrate-binding protein